MGLGQKDQSTNRGRNCLGGGGWWPQQITVFFWKKIPHHEMNNKMKQTRAANDVEIPAEHWRQNANTGRRLYITCLCLCISECLFTLPKQIKPKQRNTHTYRHLKHTWKKPETSGTSIHVNLGVKPGGGWAVFENGGFGWVRGGDPTRHLVLFKFFWEETYTIFMVSI